MYYQRPLFFRIIDSFCRHWRLFAVTALTIVVLLVVYAVTRPKTYNVQYTVVMNSQTLANPLTDQSELVNWNAVNQAVSHFQTLASTKEFDEQALTNPDGAPIPLNVPVDFNDDTALGEFQKDIDVSSLGDDAFIVSFTYRDPSDAETIAKRLIQLYIQRNAQEKSAAFMQEAAFIQQHASQTKQQLIRAEAELSAFKAQNVGHLPSQQEAVEEQLTNLEQQIQQNQQTITEDQNQYKILQQEIALTPKQIVASQTVVQSPLDAQLQNLETEVDQDIAIRGMKSNHPEVIALRQEIAKVEAELVRGKKSGSKAANGITSEDYEPNPQFEQLYNQAAELQIQREGLQAQVAYEQSLLGKAQQGAAKVPEEELILTNLEREFTYDNDTYGKLQQSLSEADMNVQLNLAQQKGMYQVFETQLPEASTSKSKTAILFLGGILLALVVAAGLVILSEAMDRSFRDPYDVQRVLGVPVLAMLPESADLHVADSRHPALPGGPGRKRLGRSERSGLLPEPKQKGAPAAAAVDTDAHTQGTFKTPEFGSDAATGAGGAATI